MDLKRYTKYFNYGYFLSKYEPKILKEFLNVTEKAPDINEPLQAGKAQFKKERIFDRLKDISKNIVPDRGIGKNIEPEI